MSECELKDFFPPGQKLIAIVSCQVALGDETVTRFAHFGANCHRLGFKPPFRLSQLRLELGNSSLTPIEDRQFQLPRRAGLALSVCLFLSVDSEFDAADISICLRDPQASDERANLRFRSGQVQALIDGQ